MVKLTAEIFIREVSFKSLDLSATPSQDGTFQLEINAKDLKESNAANLAPEVLSIESIIKENLHNIRKSNVTDLPLAEIIESGDISIRLKDESGKLYKMVQVLDINYGLFPEYVDFFECDADIYEFEFYLLCTIVPLQEKASLLITFQIISDPLVITAVTNYRNNRDLRLMDIGSGICVNVSSLPPDTESEEDNFEIGQLILLERLISKIQRNRISKKHRKRYYILGEKIFKELQKNASKP
ncbi:MAG: hypothetical protein SH817_07100 [Leptospira sp.]|nr:hypothetical protein [Leptospira sp.]